MFYGISLWLDCDVTLLHDTKFLHKIFFCLLQAFSVLFENKEIIRLS